MGSSAPITRHFLILSCCVHVLSRAGASNGALRHEMTVATSHTEQPPDGDELHTRSITSADELHTRSMYSAPRSLDLSSLAPGGVDSISSAPSRPESEHRRHHEEHTRSNGQGPSVAAGGSSRGSGDRAPLQDHAALRAMRAHPVSIGAGRRRREKHLKLGGELHISNLMSREYDDFVSLYGSHNGVHGSGEAAGNIRRKRRDERHSQRIAANLVQRSDTVIVQSPGSAGGNQSSFNSRDHRRPNGHHLTKPVHTHQSSLDRDASLRSLSQSSRETLGSLPRLSPTGFQRPSLLAQKKMDAGGPDDRGCMPYSSSRMC